jgi:hypothetical protein
VNALIFELVSMDEQRGVDGFPERLGVGGGDLLVKSRIPRESESERDIISGFPHPEQRVCAYDRHPYECDAAGVISQVPIIDFFDATLNKYHATRGACSGACAKAFIIEHGGYNRAVRLMWQRQYMIDHCGWPCDKPIPRARSWEEIEGNLGTTPIQLWRTQEHATALVISDQPSLTDTMEVEDAMESFNLHGLARPPDEENIKTKEQFLAKYPGHVSEDVGEFQKWLERNKDNLPTDEECERECERFKTQRKQERKRKAEEKEMAAAAAAMVEETPTVVLPVQEKPRKKAKVAPKKKRA